MTKPIMVTPLASAYTTQGASDRIHSPQRTKHTGRDDIRHRLCRPERPQRATLLVCPHIIRFQPLIPGKTMYERDMNTDMLIV